MEDNEQQHEDFGRTYCPSNGTEGEWFIDKYCSNCIHEKWLHSPEDDDAKKCEILSNSMLYNYNEPGYPKEWIYDEKGKPSCTCFKKWDWGSDDDGRGFNNPPPPEPYDPNQLVLPFIIEDALKQKEIHA